MKLVDLTSFLEEYAPLNYQEDYDNSGLIVGNENQEIHAALVALDCTEEIVDEAIEKKCNLIITHHPIVFKGLKKLNGKNYVERVIIKAIQNNIALYAIHTNLDHVNNGVNSKICKKIGLTNTQILAPKSNLLKKLITYCPTNDAEKVRQSLFEAGAGNISNYSECSFNTSGIGTFKANENAQPVVGEINKLQHEPETKIEVVFTTQDERKILSALFKNHPYEEVAYDIISLDNKLQNVGSGMIGELTEEIDGTSFLHLLKKNMQAKVIRHTEILPKKIRRVAVCGGSGSFLLKNAIAAKADVLVTADFKYHDFFDTEKKIMVADIGHFETEQFTSDLLVEIIKKKFSSFAIRRTELITNPINYFI